MTVLIMCNDIMSVMYYCAKWLMILLLMVLMIQYWRNDNINNDDPSMAYWNIEELWRNDINGVTQWWPAMIMMTMAMLMKYLNGVILLMIWLWRKWRDQWWLKYTHVKMAIINDNDDIDDREIWLLLLKRKWRGNDDDSIKCVMMKMMI